MKSIRNDIHGLIRGSTFVLEKKAHKDFQHVEQKLEYAEKINNILMLIRLLPMDPSFDAKNKINQRVMKRLGDLSYEIQSKVLTFYRGEELIIPGGYVNSKSGHAVIYSIRENTE